MIRETLSEEIAVVLNNQNASSDECAMLVSECEAGITEAQADAMKLRVLAADITLVPTPREAANLARDAQNLELTSERLQKILPALRKKYSESVATEATARWRGFFDPLVDERAALLQEFDATRKRMEDELADLNSRIRACNGECKWVNNLAIELNECHRLDLLPQLQLDEIDSTPSAYNEPNWQEANRAAAAFSATMVSPRPSPFSYTSEWWRADQDRVEATRREQERTATFYQEQSAEREKAENAAVHEKAEAALKRTG